MAWPVETRHGIIPRHSRGTGVAGGSAHPAGDRWLPILFGTGIACQGGAMGSKSCISAYSGEYTNYRVVSTFRWSPFFFFLFFFFDFVSKVYLFRVVSL